MEYIILRYILYSERSALSLSTRSRGCHATYLKKQVSSSIQLALRQVD